MVAVGSPDGILARNSTGSVALALIAGVANGPPLEARGCEGKRCYRPVRQWPIHPASHAPQAEAAISPQKLDLLGRDFKHAKSARAAETGPMRRPSPAWYQWRLGVKQDVGTGETLGARRQIPPKRCRL